MAIILPLPQSSAVAALWLQGRWRFDLWSALIGAGLAILVVVLLYRSRAALAGGWQRVGDAVAGVRGRFSAGLEDRYRQHLAAACRRVRLLGLEAALEEVYVVPRLLVPPPSPTEQLTEDLGLDDDAVRERRRRAAIHQRERRWPLAKVLRAARHVVVTGPAGAGKTTMLAYLALTFARRQAAERLGVDGDFLPLFVSLGKLAHRLSPDETGGKQGQQAAGPAELLLEQVAADHRRLGRRVVADLCRARLAAGRCLVLLDGLDEVPADKRARLAQWVAELAAAHPDNRYVVASGPCDHTVLLQAGFVGTTLSGFDDARIREYVENWSRATADASLAGLQEAIAAHRAWARWAAHPLTLAFLVRVYGRDGELPPDRAALYGRVVELALDAVDQSRLPTEEGRAVLGRLALHMQEGDQIAVSRAEAEALVAEALSPPAEPDEARGGQEKKARAWLKALADGSRLLVWRDGDELAFAHRSLRDYLAAWQIAETGNERLLLAHVFDLRWREVIRFYGQLRPVDGVVAALLSGKESVLHQGLFLAAGCLADAREAHEKTRQTVLARLGRVFLQAGQPLPVRIEAARALTRMDDKGVAYLFAQALRQPEAELRQAAVWGVAWLGERRALDALKAALDDGDWRVRAAAAQALGLFRGSRVVEWLAGALMDEDDDVRRAAAESLALMGEEAHSILREAVEDEDFLLRRAAIYGLGRIGGPEIESLFDSIRRDDKQWYVRSAAEEILSRLTGHGGELAARRPQDEGWLLAWAAEVGRSLGSVQQAERALVEALRDEQWAIRVAAAETLGVLGGPAAVELLSLAVGDGDEFVREAAFVALKEISRRTGQWV